MKRVCDCSSISSILNSLAANLLVDFVSPIHLHCTRKPIRDGTALLIAKSACEKRSLYMCNVQKHEGIVLMPTMFSCKSDYFSEMLYPQIAAAMPPPPRLVIISCVNIFSYCNNKRLEAFCLWQLFQPWHSEL